MTTLTNDSDRDDTLYRGLPVRRAVAFCIDVIVVGLFVLVAWLVVAMLGVLTLGAGWLLFGVVVPGTAVVYYAATLGRTGATPGLGAMGLKLRRVGGGSLDILVALAHALLAWITVWMLPFLLVVAFFDARRRLLHDMALGTEVVDAAALDLVARSSTAALPR